ncbi:hypothetical protein ABZP36_018756 [Zizania latifolia]
MLFEDSEKHKVEYEVHRLVVNRYPKFTNFVEVSSLIWIWGVGRFLGSFMVATTKSGLKVFAFVRFGQSQTEQGS